MRVLHVLRSDHASHVGGDLVQLRATVAALQEQGVDAIAGSVDEHIGAVDLVHLYNLQRPAALRRDARLARHRWPQARVVVSPIMWPPDLRLLVRAPDRWVRARVTRAWLRWAQQWWPCRDVLAGADAVLPNSETERERIARLYRLPLDRWYGVPNGISPSRWQLTRRAASADARRAWGLLEPSGLVIACVGRVESYKNQRTLVRALAHLPGASLLLVGPVAERRYAAAVSAEASRFAGRVAFVGARSADEVSEILAVCDVHVLPSFRETPGLATLEAAAAGCEVVATRHGSSPEYLGRDAGYADPTSPPSIAAAVHDVLARPRQPALAQRVARFDWESTARTLAVIYRDVLARAPARASR